MKIIKKIDGRVAGHVTLSKLVGNEWEIQYLSVEPQHRGKGIASELLKRAMEHATKNQLVLIGLPDPERDGTLNYTQIGQWLKRHGFKFGWYDFNEAGSRRSWVATSRKRVWIFNEE